MRSVVIYNVKYFLQKRKQVAGERLSWRELRAAIYPANVSKDHQSHLIEGIVCTARRRRDVESADKKCVPAEYTDHDTYKFTPRIYIYIYKFRLQER